MKLKNLYLMLIVCMGVSFSHTLCVKTATTEQASDNSAVETKLKTLEALEVLAEKDKNNVQKAILEKLTSIEKLLKANARSEKSWWVWIGRSVRQFIFLLSVLAVSAFIGWNMMND